MSRRQSRGEYPATNSGAHRHKHRRSSEKDKEEKPCEDTAIVNLYIAIGSGRQHRLLPNNDILLMHVMASLLLTSRRSSPLTYKLIETTNSPTFPFLGNGGAAIQVYFLSYNMYANSLEHTYTEDRSAAV